MRLLSDASTDEQAIRKEPLPGKILVVTSCTKDKDFTGVSQKQQLKPEHLWDEGSDDRVARDFGELEAYRKPAGDLYRGLQHKLLMQGVMELRKAFGPEVVDVKIVSAGFGLVDEKQPLPPYNATFADLPASKILPIAKRLNIPQAANRLMTGDYACAFFLLGENYLFSLGLPFEPKPKFPCFFLSGPSSRKCVPRGYPYKFVRVGQDDSISFSCNLIGLKGHLFKLFADQIVQPVPGTADTVLDMQPTSTERLKSFFDVPTPQHFLDIVSPFRQAGRVSTAQAKAQILATQPSLFQIMEASDEPVAKNYGRPMRYFIPDWDDLVDPGYDFENDRGTPGRRKYIDEVHAHQIYPKPNYDGLLFSKSTVEDGPNKTALVREMGIHAFGRFEGPILGDCGAFSYVAEKNPPYETREILDYYQNLGFDYGVSIDHLIIPAFYPVKEHRYELTRKNAREFIELHRTGNYTFTPVGVAQGWSPETYRDAVVELLECGYKFVALGGLARAKTEEVYKIMKEVSPFLKEDTDLHLFGVARDREGDEMRMFRKLGVTSFDSATYLRRAWMSATTNYFTEDGGRYAALRISPVYESSPRVRTLISEGLATVEELKKLEQEALKAVRAYDKGELDLETTLETVLEIDKLEEYNYDQHKVLYRRVLEDQPWKKCNCEICKAIGVEVIIFRSNDRNRRRGFHNTYVFYKRFRELIERS
ncbi:tRNA-guanine transglycosylase DpdA [Dictyobacter kobayashii]|uniref:tRNA-guanine(15) transglycosylase-like domain-containing protein n=1 Tax=Dictyobacter kobayashii TaxID=2014872 RepID=A0A402AVS0_9CHLR|nr:tRNA-guanine transglycosylase DpdA [Dictyobacter kobayashii]GCE23221.1 hypothetical protein KDK_70210 [Dictyobacter kobayashii]